MNDNELNNILSLGETETVEFKESPSEGFYKTISAFSNTRGGTILLGIDSNNKIKGVDSSTKFLENLTNSIVDKLSIYPEIETINIQGRRIILFKVIRSAFLVSYEGRYYERVGNTTREISEDRLRVLLSKGKTWDSLAGSFPLEEIDTETINYFVRLAVDKNRLPEVSLSEPVKVILKKLGLIQEDKLTNGAILLFGKDPQKHFINLCVRIGRFKTETVIIDDKWAKGNLFKQFEETLNVLRQNISVRYEIKTIEREDIWDYPILSLREVVMNALIHRDYFNIANLTVIKVYDDHVWFFNPGGLPEGITIDQLKIHHQSFLRNPLIAKVFYLAGFIDQYGSGTVRMVEWMKSAGLPEPEYKEEQGGFSVYFYKDIYTEENLRKMQLNERQIKAVMFVKERGRITNKEYQKICGVRKRQATDDLKELEEKGVFDRIGTTGKGTHYILKERQRGERGSKGAPKGTKET